MQKNIPIENIHKDNQLRNSLPILKLSEEVIAEDNLSRKIVIYSNYSYVSS